MFEIDECPRLTDVHRLWDGELDGLRAYEVREHLAHCPACRAEYESWQPLSRLLARGAPAPSLDPKRRRVLKEELLRRCAADRVEPLSTGSGRCSLRLWGGRGPALARVALALAALANVLLLPRFGGRVTAPREPRVRVSPPPALRRPPRIARALAPLKQPVVSLQAPSHQDRKRPRAAIRHRRVSPVVRIVANRLPRRLEPARHGLAARVRLAAAPWGQRRRAASRPSLSAALLEAPATVLAGSSAPAPQPIERLVIQEDGPPAAPLVQARTITRICIIAAGDLRAPGAELAVVRYQKKEELP